MNRYLSSFIISALSYLAIIVAIIYIANIDTRCNANAKVQNVKKVCFSVINQHVAQKPEKEKKIVPKPKPKSKPKPKPKSKPKPKPKPIAKPIPIPEPVIEEVVEVEAVKEIVEEETQEVLEEVVSVTETQNKINPEVLQAKQDLFINYLIHKINNNKSYPNMARRRGIEGLVDVKFKILSDGNVENIKIISGRSIFKKSAAEAISRSFPISVDNSIFDFPKEFKIKISYILK